MHIYAFTLSSFSLKKIMINKESKYAQSIVCVCVS